MGVYPSPGVSGEQFKMGLLPKIKGYSAFSGGHGDCSLKRIYSPTFPVSLLLFGAHVGVASWLEGNPRGLHQTNIISMSCWTSIFLNHFSGR